MFSPPGRDDGGTARVHGWRARCRNGGRSDPGGTARATPRARLYEASASSSLAAGACPWTDRRSAPARDEMRRTAWAANDGNGRNAASQATTSSGDWHSARNGWLCTRAAAHTARASSRPILGAPLVSWPPSRRFRWACECNPVDGSPHPGRFRLRFPVITRPARRRGHTAMRVRVMRRWGTHDAWPIRAGSPRPPCRRSPAWDPPRAASSPRPAGCVR